MLAAVKKLFKPTYVYRSSITGRYVSRLYAFLHPNTTVRERVDA